MAEHIRNIIFDLGNVLIHCDLDFAAHELAAHSDVSQAEIKRRLLEHPLLNEFDEGRYSGEEFVREMERLVGWSGSADELERIWQTMLNADEVMFEYLESLLQRGVQTYILSNANPFHTDYVKTTYPKILDTHGQIFSCECRLIKPNEAIFHLARKTFSVEPHDTVFIDDRPDNVEAAKRVGFHGIVHRSYEETREALEAMLAREDVS